ncbi:MAG: hypothetical protein ACYC01_00725 [Lutibacter sp.]
MENKADNNKPTKVHKEIQSTFKGQSIYKNETFEELENKINAKILKITMVIKEKYPELLEFLNEMPETIPVEKNPEITLNNLKKYGESLNSILIKYELEHSYIPK